MIANSARLYFLSFGKLFWGFIVYEVTSIVGLAQVFGGLTKDVPSWTWWAAILFGFSVFPFIAFHRRELEVKKTIDLRDTKVLAEKKRADEAERLLSVYESNRNQDIALGSLVDEASSLYEQRMQIQDDQQLERWIEKIDNWIQRTKRRLEIASPTKAACFLAVNGVVGYSEIDFDSRFEKQRARLWQYRESLKTVVDKVNSSVGSAVQTIRSMNTTGPVRGADPTLLPRVDPHPNIFPRRERRFPDTV